MTAKTPRKQVRRRRLGAMSVEYLAILTLVVLPLALGGVPLSLKAIRAYTQRLAYVQQLPFP